MVVGWIGGESNLLLSARFYPGDTSTWKRRDGCGETRGSGDGLPPIDAGREERKL